MSAAAAPIAASASASAAPTAAPPHGTAPFPYTVDQIRGASKKGRRIELRMETAGKPTVHRVLEFTASDEQGGEITATVLDEGGKKIDGPKASRSTWAELQKHAEFPRAAATITEAKITVPAGTFDCLVYRVTEGAGADAAITTYHFAKSLPGPPILFFTDQGGKRVMTVTMLANKPGS